MAMIRSDDESPALFLAHLPISSITTTRCISSEIHLQKTKTKTKKETSLHLMNQHYSLHPIRYSSAKKKTNGLFALVKFVIAMCMSQVKYCQGVNFMSMVASLAIV